MKNALKQIWAGFLVGTANIIPGVSGGTLLFILGLYERTLGALGNFKAESVKSLLRSACGTIFSSRRKYHLKNVAEQAVILDLPFLITIAAGAGTAILMLSSLMEYLLENQFSNTYAFFFGLIAISVLATSKMMKTKKLVHITHFIIGAAVTVMVTVSVDPSVSAGIKSERYKEELISAQSVVMASANHLGDDVLTSMSDSVSSLSSSEPSSLPSSSSLLSTTSPPPPPPVIINRSAVFARFQVPWEIQRGGVCDGGGFRRDSHLRDDPSGA